MKRKTSISISKDIFDWLKEQHFNISGYVEAIIRKKMSENGSINTTKNDEVIPKKEESNTTNLQEEIDKEVNKILGV